MSLMPPTLHSAAFNPTTINNKWRIRHVLSSHNNTTRQIKTHIVSSTKPNIVTRPISQLNYHTPNCVTRATSASVAVAVPTETIILSDLEKKRNGGFWFRDWDKVDVTHLGLMIGKHVLAVCAPFVLNWGAFWVTVVLSIFTGMGVTQGLKVIIGFLLTGVSSSPNGSSISSLIVVSMPAREIQYFGLAYTRTTTSILIQKRTFIAQKKVFGSVILVGSITMTILLLSESRSGQYSNVPELKAQWFYRFLHDTYVWNTIGLGTLLYLLGLSLPSLGNGHAQQWLTTSPSLLPLYIWGERPWKTPDTSTNNWWVALLTFGEGWHNNHHAFPSSACHGMEWWQLDLTWELIKFLEMVGLAKDVKLPTEAEKTRMMVCSI